MQITKISILSLQFPPENIGGTEIATYNLSRELAAKGNAVHVITSVKNGVSERYESDGFTVHRTRLSKTRYIGTILFWIRTLATIRKINPDIVHVQGIGAGVPALLAKIFFGKPYVVWCQGSDVYLDWRHKKEISLLVLGRSDLVITLTEHMRRTVCHIMDSQCSRKTHIIGNGIRDEFEGFLSKRREYRCELGYNDSDVVLIFAGRLSPIKSLDTLIAAVGLLKEMEKNVRLLVVGEGGESEKLKELTKELSLENEVEFVGKVNNSSIPKFLCASDIFVLPSISEGFPIVILEAMASGLPIVASNVGGLPEIVKEGQNGFLVPPKDTLQLYERILLLMQDRNLRDTIRKNNLAESKLHFWSDIAQDLEDVYIRAVFKGSH